jgi:orotidine-5'-phosphate decarboxylase
MADTPNRDTPAPMRSFMDRLRDRWEHADTLVCVGLDPEPAKFPARFAHDPDAIFHFCRDIVDATAPYVCAFKPQIAHFAAAHAEEALRMLILHIGFRHPGIPVILDSKRGDIGSTAQHYASEAFDRYGADAVTVNLCRTSNAGAGDLQDMTIAGRPLYQHVAEKIARDWNEHGNCALVVGATWPEQLREVRTIVGDVPFLVPGVGAQGGDVEAVVKNARSRDGTGLIVSSSRAILYASNGDDYAQAAAAAARDLRDQINRHR